MQGKQNLIIQRGYLAGATLMPPGINLWNQFLRESVFRALARERILNGPSNLRWLRILTCDWFALFLPNHMCLYYNVPKVGTWHTFSHWHRNWAQEFGTLDVMPF